MELYHIEPSGVTLLYTYIRTPFIHYPEAPSESSLHLYGEEKKISEVERRILEAAKKFEEAESSMVKV